MGRTIGIDLGGARCGVAIDDELGQLAHPRPNLPAKDRKALVAALAELAKQESATRFVIGLPLEMNGEEGRAAERVRTFAQHLADKSGLAVELVDERLTTVEASAALRDAGLDARAQKDKIDGAAAATILQTWLDARRARRARKEKRS
ncbi:MAG: Holliday junction resolvase RuvX [Polyangiales bacterium]